MFNTDVPRASGSSRTPFNVYTNPYKAQRTWPPDFSKMDPKHQFRLERRYKRRSKLAYLRPGWVNGVKIAQWTAGLSVFGYGVLFMDWGETDKPFAGIRKWVFERSESMWTATTIQPQRPSPGSISERTT